MEKLKTLLRTNLLQFIPTTSLGFKIALPFAVAVTLLLVFWESVYANHELIRNIGLVSAALIGFPMLIWRTRIADRQAIIGESNHAADTYTKAIEQLGAKDSEGKPHLELRLGGLYALERIAKRDQEYHPQIMEVLCAYVRMRSQRLASRENSAIDEQLKSSKIPLPQSKELETDIRAILTVIGRRNTDFDDSVMLDFSNANFAGYGLSRYNLSGCNLSRIDLAGATLFGADLSRAELFSAGLSGADLSMADFSRANLALAELLEANLNRANLHRANLHRANLHRANLRTANLTDANLTDANLTDANLTRANLTGADLAGADLTGADLTGVNLAGVELTKAQFRSCII